MSDLEDELSEFSTLDLIEEVKLRFAEQEATHTRLDEFHTHCHLKLQEAMHSMTDIQKTQARGITKLRKALEQVISEASRAGVFVDVVDFSSRIEQIAREALDD